MPDGPVPSQGSFRAIFSRYLPLSAPPPPTFAPLDPLRRPLRAPPPAALTAAPVKVTPVLPPQGDDAALARQAEDVAAVSEDWSLVPWGLARGKGSACCSSPQPPATPPRGASTKADPGPLGADGSSFAARPLFSANTPGPPLPPSQRAGLLEPRPTRPLTHRSHLRLDCLARSADAPCYLPGPLNPVTALEGERIAA